MTFDPDKPETWPSFSPLIIAHDVGCSRDRSTAVVGGPSPLQPNILGLMEFIQLPQGLFGTARASELAAIDRRHQSNGLIVADVSNDRTYVEVLHETFGQRAIGLHITRSGDGMTPEWRPVRGGAMQVYTIGRSDLLEHFHTLLQSHLVRMTAGPDSRLAYQQLAELELELRESGVIYKCPPGRHDDLAISCAMLAWAARHPHLPYWVPPPRRRRPPAPQNPWAPFV